MRSKSIITKTLDAAGLKRESWLRSTFNERYEYLRRERRIEAHAFRSFSQFGEDAFVQSMLRDSPLRGQMGVYLDIGSGEPIRGSNTYALYRQGWAGTLVDPIRHNVVDSQRFRPRDRIIQACVGAEPGFIDFVEFETYEFSTASPARLAELQSQGWEPRGRYQTPVITVEQLGIGMTPESPTVMSIDVEGGEDAVLDGINWDTCSPAILIIEEWDGPLAKESLRMRRLADCGYEITAVVGYSSIYRHHLFPRRR